MKRMLWVLLVMSIGATFPSSLFPLYQEQFHLSSLQLTILFASYAAALLPALLIIGSRGSAWGLKKVLRTSILLSLLSTFVFLLGNQAWMLFLGRILEGIAFGAFTGTAVAFLLQQSPAHETGRALRFSAIVNTVGFGLGPAITGLVIQYIQLQPMHLPYGILTVLLASGTFALETLADTASPQTTYAPAKISLGVPSAIRPYFWSFIALPIFMVFTLNGVVLSLIPSFVKNVIHSSNLAVSGLLILVLFGIAAVSQLFGWPRQSITRVRFGVVLLALGAWFTVISGQTANLGLLWTGIFIQAIGMGWTFQGSLQLAGRLPKPEERNKVISTYYLAGYAGFIVPIVGVGMLTFLFALNLALILLNIVASVVILYIFLFSFRFERFYNKLHQTSHMSE
ncbi:UNVERIFIED_CONTAM: MFS family permease [Brevibacillus sp. OAP136]